MLRLVLHRVGTAALTLLLVTLLVFILVQLAPGSPLAERLDAEGFQRLTPAERAEVERLYHLDRPFPERYALWITDLARGDLGRSFHDRRPVAEKIGERLSVSVALNLVSLIVMVGLAIPIGAAGAFRPGSAADRFGAAGTYVLYAVPVFWAGLLLQIVFSVRLGWLPLAGWTGEGHETLGLLGRVADRARHLVLPVICLSYGGLAYLSRFVRAALLENSRGEAALAARARGLTGLAVLYRHGFRLAAVPMLTLAGFLLPALVGGSVIVETVFSIPGLGRLFIDAAFQRDTPVLMGLTLLSGVATLTGILLADLAYAFADPRIRRR